jgi:uncharacterized protein HemX
MDPNLQNLNDNNSRPAGPGSVDGFAPSTPVSTPPTDSNLAAMPPVATMGSNLGSRAEAGQQLLNNMPAKAAQAGRGSRAITTIFLVLFLLAAAGAGYLYWQYDSAKKDLTTEQAATQSLRTQLSDTQTSAAEQATDLQTKTDFITELGTIAQQLKTQCGTGCNSITIPVLEEDSTTD